MARILNRIERPITQAQAVEIVREARNRVGLGTVKLASLATHAGADFRAAWDARAAWAGGMGDFHGPLTRPLPRPKYSGPKAERVARRVAQLNRRS